jgi:single-strand DNA-binding protein
MANLNKVMLIGRLTRDPEVRTFANGGKVAKFGFACNNKKKNMSTGQWEDEPVFIEMDVFNKGEQGKQADLVEQHLRKGQQVFIEGHLRFEQWTSPEGQKRSKLLVRVDNFQFLEARTDGGSGGSRYSRPAPAAQGGAGMASSGDYDSMGPEMEPSSSFEPPAGASEIPF